VSTTNTVAANQSAYAYKLANQRIKNTHKEYNCFDSSEGHQIANHAFIRHPRNEQYYGLTPFSFFIHDVLHSMKTSRKSNGVQLKSMMAVMAFLLVAPYYGQSAAPDDGTDHSETKPIK
jgi:Ca2+-binding EF-hand superfamily protein